MQLHRTGGRLIVLEGIDGSGKSTGAKRLAEHYLALGARVLLTHEPTRAGIGGLLRQYLESENAITPEVFQLLFIADRLTHLHDVIMPALEQNKTVICDRYHFSTLAYGKAQGCSPSVLSAADEKIIQPDFAIYFKMTPAVALQRIALRGAPLQYFEAEAKLTPIAAAYDELLAQGALQAIDAAGTPDQTFANLLKIVT